MIIKNIIPKTLIQKVGKEAIEETVAGATKVDLPSPGTITKEIKKDVPKYSDKRTKDIKDYEEQKKLDPTEDEPVVTTQEEEIIDSNNVPPLPPEGGGGIPPGGSSGDFGQPSTGSILFGKDGVVPNVKKNTPDNFLYTHKNIAKITDTLDDEQFKSLIEFTPIQLNDFKKLFKESDIALPAGFGKENLDRISSVVVSSKNINIEKMNTIKEIEDYVTYLNNRVTKAMKDEGVSLGKTKKTLVQMIEESNAIPQAEAFRAALSRPEGVNFINSADLIKMKVIEDVFYRQTKIQASKLININKKLNTYTPEERATIVPRAKFAYNKAIKLYNLVSTRNTSALTEMGRTFNLAGRIDQILGSPNKFSNIANSLRAELNEGNLIEHAEFLLKASADPKSGKVFIQRTAGKVWNGKYGIKAMTGAWIQSLLGSIHMHIHNFVENAANSNLLFVFEMIPAALIGNAKNYALKAFKSTPWTRNIFKSQKDYAQFRDIITTYHAEAHSMGNALNNARRTFVENNPIDPMTKLFQNEREIFKPDPDLLPLQSKISKLYNKFLYTTVNLPGRAMTSADEFFATKTFNREALIEISREVDDIMVKTGDVAKAKIHAKRRIEDFDTAFSEEILRTTRKSLYKDEGKLLDPSTLEKGIDSLISFGSHPIIKTQIPFSKVYVNIMSQVMKRTPFAITTPGFYRDLARGGRHTDMAISRFLTGTTAIVSAAYIANGQFRDDNDTIVVGHIPKFSRVVKGKEDRRSLVSNFREIGIDKEKHIYIRKPGETTFRNATKIPLRSLGIQGELLSMGADYSMCTRYSNDLGALTKFLFCNSYMLYRQLSDLPYIDGMNAVFDLAYIRDSNDLSDAITARVIKSLERPLSNSALMLLGINVGFFNSLDRMWVTEAEQVAPRDYTVNDYDTNQYLGDDTEEAFRKALRYTLNTFEALPFVDEQSVKRDRFGRSYDNNSAFLEYRTSSKEKPSYDYTMLADTTPENDTVSMTLFNDNIATYVGPPLRLSNVKLTKYERQRYHYLFTTTKLETLDTKGRPAFPGKGPMTWYDTLNELFTGDSDFSAFYKEALVLSLKDEFQNNIYVTRNELVDVFEKQFTEYVRKNMLDPANGNLYSRVQLKRGQ